MDRHSGPSVQVRGVSRRFGGVQALDGVDVDIASGTLHALVGGNGAGKSTLGKLLAGWLLPDAGTLALDGVPCRFRSTAEARAAGVALVPQELVCCPDLSVAESLALSRWPRRGPGALFVDRRALAEQARAALAPLGVELAVDARTGSLPVAQIQLVQIAAALGSGARLLVLDEPTAALSAGEAARLATLLVRLRDEGRTLVLVSHRLPEVLALADAATVLRDGRVVARLSRAELSESALVSAMAGRAATPSRAASAAGSLAAARGAPPAAGPRLDADALHVHGRLHDISLSLHAGEIVGLAGLVGAGRSELLCALFGLLPRRGAVTVDGRALPPGRPRAARAAGIALVPEDRQRQGLLVQRSVRFNWSLPRWRRWAMPGTALFGGGLLRRRAERHDAQAALARAGVQPADPERTVAQLSGGNQQKLLLARWLDTGAHVLLVDEPTRGVDVAAKAQIHDQLRARAAHGAALLVASSDLPELRELCDRVLVLRDGRLVADFARGTADEERLLAAMTGARAAVPSEGAR